MNVLYLSHKPIYPIVDGGCKAMHQFLTNLLDAGYLVDHCCISTPKHPFSLSAYQAHQKRLNTINHIQVDTTVKLSKAFEYIFRTGSYNIERFNSRSFHDFLRATFKHKAFDFVILESLFLAPYIATIRSLSDVKLIMRSHNVEYKLWNQQAQRENNVIKRIYLKKLASDIKCEEYNVLRRVDHTCCITEQDKQHFLHQEPTLAVSTVPMSMQTSSHLNALNKSAICFLGSMNWKPNQEAAHYIYHQLFPALKKRIPALEFHLAGSHMHGQFPSKPKEGIFNHEFVEDSAEFLKSYGVLVLPIQSASGVRVKMLEALALGVPIVTTRIGALGINDLDVVSYVEHVDELESAVHNLLNHDAQLRKQRELGLEYIHSGYSNEAITKQLKLILESI
jgi:glycosyltransferase involved in cell wall biosynthesis